MTQLLAALLSALIIAASTNASPIDNLLVVSPKIISPKKGDNWPIGSTQYVEWDPTQIPKTRRASFSSACWTKLGYRTCVLVSLCLPVTHDPPWGINNTYPLVADHPLTQGFHLAAGYQQVVVPNVPLVTTYVVVRKFLVRACFLKANGKSHQNRTDWLTVSIQGSGDGHQSSAGSH
jgi:hypothetical protein